MEPLIHEIPGLTGIKGVARGLRNMLVSLMDPIYKIGDPIQDLGLLRELKASQAIRVEALGLLFKHISRNEMRRLWKEYTDEQVKNGEPPCTFREYKKLVSLCRAALLQGGMGVGKSIMALAVARYRYLTQPKNSDGSHRALNMVIACPPSLVSTWMKEIALTLPAGTYNYVDLLRDDLPETGMNICFQTYTQIQTHYTRDGFVKNSNLSEKGLKRLKKIDQEIVLDNASNLTYLPSVDARCLRCGNKIVKSRKMKKDRVTGTEREVVVYYTAEEIQKLSKENGPAMICTEPRYQGKFNKWDDEKYVNVPTTRQYWRSTEGVENKIPLCGEVLVAPRQSKLHKPVVRLDPNHVDPKGKPILSKDSWIAKRRKEKPVLSSTLFSPESIKHKAGFTNTATSLSDAYLAKKRLRGKIDFAIMDEVHHLKSNGKLGRSGRWLMTSAKQVLMLTGTLTGGKARDLYYLLWGLAYNELVQDGYNFPMLRRFCDTYGSHKTWEVETEVKKKGKKVKQKQIRRGEIAGIAASVYVDYCVSRSVFLELEDMDEDLAPYTEHRVFVNMTDEMEKEYSRIDAEFRAAMGAARSAGVRNTSPIVSSFLHRTNSWPDRLRQDVVKKDLEIKNKDGEVTGTFPVRIDLSELLLEKTPKDEWLIEHIKKSAANGEKVLVYITYVNKRDCIARIQTVLEKAGIRVGVLRSGKPKTSQRKQWIDDNTPNFDCLLCHPDLVKEGMNLLPYTQIVWIGPDYNIYRLRQANKRSRRLNQTKPVEVWYLGYTTKSGICTQELAWMLIASKLDSALIAEGNPSDSALFEISYSPDSVLREMMHAFIDGTADSYKHKGGTITTVVEIIDGEKPNLPVSTPEGHPIFVPSNSTEPVVTIADSGKVYVTERVRQGRKQVTITREVSVDQVEEGAQLALFNLDTPQTPTAEAV